MEGEDNYSDILFNLNRCSLVDFNGSEYASYRTASDMERYLAIDNYYLHHAHEADPTAQTRPSLHIETQGIHTIFRIDSTGVLQQFTGTSLETCRPVKIEECSLSIASGGRLAGLQTDDSTFVLIFENSAGHLESVRLQQGRLNRLSTFPVDREPDSAFIAVNETYDTFKVYYQHRDKHIHCLVADTGSGRWNADSSLTNSHLDSTAFNLLFISYGNGNFAVYVPDIASDNVRHPDMMKRLVEIGPNGERIERERPCIRVLPWDENSGSRVMTMPISFNPTLKPRQSGVTGTTVRPT